jgi:hypothetical protein
MIYVNSEDSMKNKIIVLLLLVSLLVSAFSFTNGNGLQNHEASPIETGKTPPTQGDDDQGGGAINPLTGLPVTNSDNLLIPPALVSITNWPTSARPQAGLSYSPIVFEFYIGDGESRFLAMFYGDYPQEEVKNASGNSSDTGSVTIGTSGNTDSSTSIGPIRSGRLFYSHLSSLYNGSLIQASAWKGIAKNLNCVTNILGADAGDINSAMISVTRLEEIAKTCQDELGSASLTGMTFDPVAPAGGKEGQTFWMIYNANDMVKWDYNEAAGSYLRYQDNADGKTFIKATDRLNDEALTYENIVLLFANHRYCTEYAFDVDLMYVNRSPALLFRDGKVYNIYWTTKNEGYELTTGKVRPIRFMDENGDPFPFKPGQTWIHLVPYNTPYWESPDSDALFDLLNKKEEGSGVWVSRFYKSWMVFDQAVCDQIR